MMLLNKVKKKLLNTVFNKSKQSFLIKNLKNISVIQNQNFWNQLPIFNTITPQELQIDTQTRILILSPHPDDDTFGAGGFALLAQKFKSEIFTLYLTHGAGDADQHKKIQEEILAVSKILSSNYKVLNNTPNGLKQNNEIQEVLKKIILEFKPELIFLPFILDDHPDHQETGKILCSVLANLKNENPITIMTYQIYGLIPTNCILDITSVMPQKEHLMSQWKAVNGNRNWVHYIKGLNSFNSRYKPGKEPMYIETYLKLSTTEYVDLINSYVKNNE